MKIDEAGFNPAPPEIISLFMKMLKNRRVVCAEDDLAKNCLVIAKLPYVEEEKGRAANLLRLCVESERPSLAKFLLAVDPNLESVMNAMKEPRLHGDDKIDTPLHALCKPHKKKKLIIGRFNRVVHRGGSLVEIFVDPYEAKVSGHSSFPLTLTLLLLLYFSIYLYLSLSLVLHLLTLMGYTFQAVTLPRYKIVALDSIAEDLLQGDQDYEALLMDPIQELRTYFDEHLEISLLFSELFGLYIFILDCSLSSSS